MELRRFLLSLFVLGCVVFAASAFADEKLGYVSLEKILRESPQAIDIGKRLQKEFAPRGDELNAMQKQINDKTAALEKDAVTLSETDRRNREQDLSTSNIELQRKKRELSEDFDLRKGQELAVLQDHINKALTAIAQSEGYDLVMYENVAYASKAVDITDKVMKAIGN
jgi:outer membrane protein